MIKKSHAAGDYVFIGASQEDADEIIKLNTFTFAGIQLEIVESDDSLEYHGKATESKDTQELRAKLQAILGQRYQGANKLLKLDALASDPELVTLGMFENRERALKTFKGLMAICDGLFKTAVEKREAIESISIANNSIDDISQVESLATTFPQLKNLDISGNQLSNMKTLDPWKGKFRELETIYVTGNPLENLDASYQTTLLDWFPNLQNINGSQVRTAEQIAQQRAAGSRSKAIPQSGPDFRDVNGIGENFLLEFFAAFDHDRQGLSSRFYDEASKFSLAVDTRSARRESTPAPLPWSAYIKVSRNLMKITTVNARTQRLFKGVDVIADVWKSLPLTKHPNIKEDLSKYIMDCHPLSGLGDPNGQTRTGVDGLIISVHGEFEELDQKSGERGQRSFSRTFVLGPGQAGKGPIRVVSDMLSLRAYNPLPNVFAQTTANNAHQAMVDELSKQTGMVSEYCEMCLSQVDWQFDKAIAMFHEKKAALPTEAFSSVSRC
ncbi:mRNA export factor mex67 [Ophiocordyceps camponoti-floridani]|uniref:mRNA export factor mex67 n=1 Tax=Ophiocordyceps camponoti-floridani TaxID=2030778 RepID=A0A8H4VGC7_9HYPO|nr:mRNA export factor mex67 [Ophiocordyceps camponoti-floridani]